MNFKSKNVVFIGGLGGIGYETCKQLLTRPIASLFVCDVIENASAIQALQTINTKCKVRFIHFDVADKSSIRNGLKIIVADVTYIDILVNGAGILSEKNYERMLAINLTGLITTTFEALPHMDKQRHGRGGLIVNVASIGGLDPSALCVVYTASKFGIVGFSRAISDPYYNALTGVAVTVLCPGFTDTPMRSLVCTEHTFEYSKQFLDLIPQIKTQTAANCCAHFLRVIEANKNGAIWISDGDLRETEMTVYWTPTIVEKCQ